MKRLLPLLVVMALAVPAMADDFAPPWYRGEPLSYQAEWDMFTDGSFATGIYTDYENAVDDGDPSTVMDPMFVTLLHFDASSGWRLTPDEGGGIWNFLEDATFTADVANWIDLMPRKLLRVQVTFTDAGGGAPVILGVEGFGPISGGDPHVSCLEASVLVDANHFYEDWFIFPNPDYEEIEFFLPMGTIVEQIVIDTVSPEPASMGLLALGAVAVLRRRKK